jgi:hypothetical protein
VPTPTPTPDLWGGLWTAAGLTWLGLLVALPVLIVLAAAAAIVSWAWRRHTRVGPPHLAVPLRDRELAHRMFDVELTRAASTWPEHYAPTYAPRVTVSPAAPAQAPLSAGATPSLAELLGRATGLVLGIGDDDLGHDPVVLDGEWTSVGIGGRPGSGKSNTIGSLIAQHVLRGGEVLVGDPHAGAPRSLARRLEPLQLRVENEPREILRLAERAHGELERRKRLGAVGAGDWRPLALVVDEWTSLMRGDLAERLARLLTALISEGQKYTVTVLLAAQAWTAATVGGSFLRNPLPTAVVHRTRPDEARVLTGLRGDAIPADVLQLPAGAAYVVSPTVDGVRRVRVPRVEPDEVARLLPRSASTPASDSLPGCFPNPEASALEVVRKRPGSGPGSAPGSGREAEILALFRQGQSLGQIATLLAGQRGGRPWQEAREQVESVIRRAVGGGEG